MNFPSIKQETQESYLFLLKWLFIALLGGIFGAFVVKSFSYLLQEFSSLIEELTIPEFILPAIGGVIVGNSFYLAEAEASGEGIPSYIRAINSRYGSLNPSATLFKYLAALFTLSFRGSGGVVGPLCRVSGGIMSYIAGLFSRIRSSENDQRVATICGVSGAMGTILHTPIGGGMFAVEILARASMTYKNLFPAILASSFSFIISKAMGFSPFYKIDAPTHFMEIKYFGWLLLLAFLSGFIGILFVTIYEKISTLFKRLSHLNIATIIGGSICGLLSLATVDILGTGSNLFTFMSKGHYHRLQRVEFFGKYLVLLFLMLIVLKILATSLTIGSGLSAGFTGPTMFLGIFTALVISNLSGVELSSSTFYAFMAAGISGMLASVMNVPIAGAVIVTEIFGLNYSFPAAWGSIIAFQIARHRTIYRYSMSVANQ